jgi:hypothetical protein
VWQVFLPRAIAPIRFTNKQWLQQARVRKPLRLRKNISAKVAHSGRNLI